MTHLNPWILLGAVLATAVAFFAFRDVRLPLEGRRLHSIVPVFTFVALAALCYFLMPLKVDIVAWTNLDGSPVVTNPAPFDGNTTFFLFAVGPVRYGSNILASLGVAGMLLCLIGVRDNYSKLRPLALFPIVTIAAVLVLTKLPRSPFSGFNLWDMIKDVPNWYGGFIYGVFAIVLADFVASVVPPRAQLAVLAAACVALVAANAANIKLMGKRMLETTYYCPIGGSKNLSFLMIAERLEAIKSPLSLYIPRESRANRMFYSYPMYGMHVTVYNYDRFSDEELSLISREGSSGVPMLLVADTKAIPELEAKLGHGLVPLISKLPRSEDEGLFQLGN